MSKRSDLSFIRENAGRTVSINHEREKVEIDLISKCLRKSDFERIAAYLAVTYTDNTTGLIFAEVTDPDINEPSGEIINAIVQTGEFAIFTVSWC